MNREDIIRMAREAGCLGPGKGGDPNGLWEPNGHENVTALMVRFATLVAKHTVSNIDPASWMSYQEGLAAGAAAEREACARACDEVGNQDSDNHAWDAAAAIRGGGHGRKTVTSSRGTFLPPIRNYFAAGLGASWASKLAGNPLHATTAGIAALYA